MDSFIAVFKNIHTCNTETFEPWLKSIVVHKAIDYYRRHQNDLVFGEIEFVLDDKAGISPAQNIEAEELIKMLQLDFVWFLIFTLLKDFSIKK